jgi:hypothetical protein
MTIGPRKVDRPLVLYGYGRLGHLAEEIFRELKIPISSIMNLDTDGKYRFQKSKEVLNKNNCLLAICVATMPYAQVTAPLIAAGWVDVIPVWDIIEAYPEVGLHNGWFVGKLSHGDEACMKYVLSHWEDLSESNLHYKQFVIWRSGTSFGRPELQYIKITPCPSLPSTLADIRQRQRVHHYYEYFAPIPDLISIHAEGCELKTLEENMHLFVKYRPTIEVACYHSRDGLWRIEKFLMDNLPDYRWTFRLTAYMGQGAYITGVPEEKI